MSRLDPPHDRRRPSRGAMTLLELVIAMAVMLLVVGTLAGLAKGVQLGFEHGEAYGTITQHARVALERITRAANEAKANRHFPGFLVVAENDSNWRFPETLVIWSRSTVPSDTDLPVASELICYCPERGTPNVLIELKAPADATPMPSLDRRALSDAAYAANLATWQTKIASIRGATNTTKVQLTSMLRTAAVAGFGQRGAVRFETRLAPADTLLKTKAWADLQPYAAQSLYGQGFALRQAWVRIELQLQPQTNMDVTDAAGLYPVPFFGSAAVYYIMQP